MKQTWAGGASPRRPILATALVLLVLVVGCGGDEEPASPTAAEDETATERAIDLQGHRGARGLRPENTLPSFEAALDAGVTTLELDLHLSADNVVMVWHDPIIDPAKCRLDPNAATTAPDPDDPSIGEDARRIRNLTAAQIAAYRCDRNPDPDRFPDQEAAAGEIAGDDYFVPTLDEVFRFVDDYASSDVKPEGLRDNARFVRFNVETKRRADDPAAIGDGFDGVSAGPFELAVLEAIDRAGTESRTTIQSFDHRSLWAIRAVNGRIGLAALTTRSDIPDFAALAGQGATIWSPDYRSVDAESIAEAHAAGLAVIPWTVNDPVDMASLIDLGVDGIITDRPDLAPTT